MRSLKIVLLSGLVICLLAGCSEKQKDAAKLEQEMQEMEGEGDSGVETMGEEAETSGETPVADAAAIPEEEQPEPLSMPPAPQGDGYTVQVASCENQEYASHLVDVYFGRGYEAFVSTALIEGQTYYRVRIGNVESLAEAKELKLELADRYSIEPWIDQLNQ
ncbi:MAG: SPOR domain-containing protein [bacterium]|nr:SPOR domain-containing protein [bacterium]